MQKNRRSAANLVSLCTRLAGKIGGNGTIAWFAIPLCFVALAVVALRSAEALAQDSDTSWDAKYWNNTTLTGDATLTRTDSSLSFDWGAGSPGTDIPSDNFSARWERTLNISADQAGSYTFTVAVDDGVKLWVGDDLLIDSWIEQTKTTYEAKVSLSAGQHAVTVEYLELTGNASISVSWAREPSLPTTYWKAEYFNNKSLSGNPQLTRGDARIDFDWGNDSPATGLNVDGFSVRWSRILELPAGDYRFTATVDDGVRLFVGGRTLIDEWQVQAAAEHSQIIYLDGGPVTVQMEYFEETGEAEAQLTWYSLNTTPTVTPTPSVVWQALYWNNRTLTGGPVLAQQESSIDYDWGEGSPAAGTVNTDNFSARWTTTISLTPGSYRFDILSDDGMRLFVDDVIRLEAWKDQPATAYNYTLQHSGGNLTIKLEYYEHVESARIRLTWTPVTSATPTVTPTSTTSPTVTPTATPATPTTVEATTVPPPQGTATPTATPTATTTVTPTPDPNSVVTVDDKDSGFQRGGLATTWKEENEGHAGHLYWTNNNDRTRNGYNWGQWSPDLEAASYEVFVYVPQNHATTGNARYWISHSGGFTLREVDQSSTAGKWISLGTYTFSGTADDYVTLSDVTYETYLSRKVAWDAMKWEKK